MKAEQFFTSKEKAEIAAAISEVEKNTAGEIAIMVVDQSDSYPESNILTGFVLGGMLSLIITEIFFDDSLTWFMIFFTALFLSIALFINFFPGLKRLFISKNRLIEMVREQAVQAFYEKELYKTRDATAVFFFISLFERKLWILADKGINSKIPPTELQIFAGDMAEGIRKGKAANVLCQEITQLGQVLAEYFPPRVDNVDELSNQVIVG